MILQPTIPTTPKYPTPYTNNNTTSLDNKNAIEHPRFPRQITTLLQVPSPLTQSLRTTNQS